MAVLPMFPLGTVLLPSAVIPLHVFEPRYLALVHDCLAADREFGIVLIARGSEVGGDDQRTDAGTVARIVEAVEMPDGRWAIGAVGVRRVLVRTWLPDDPYPRADVDEWPDVAPGPDHPTALERTVTLLRRSLGMAAEAGDHGAPATIELSNDPVLAGYQASAVAAIGPHDRQRLLVAASPDERLAALEAMLEESIEVLQLRLAGG